MLADLLQEVAELKRTIEKNEKVLLKKSYWENHLSRKIEKLKEENKKLKADTEHTIKFNNKIIGKLKLENDKLKLIIKNNDLEQKADWKHIEELEEENKKLKEFKEKREESMFYFKALIERAEPKTAREAEDLQKAKKIFEKIYREKLGYLEQENTKLKEENKWFKKKIKQEGKYVAATMKENKKLRDNYYNLSKIVETTGGYKASYVNELRDKIAKLEFDIEARIKLKAVREDKERILNKEIMGLRDQKYNHGEPVVSSGPCFVGGNIS